MKLVFTHQKSFSTSRFLSMDSNFFGGLKGTARGLVLISVANLFFPNLQLDSKVIWGLVQRVLFLFCQRRTRWRRLPQKRSLNSQAKFKRQVIASRNVQRKSRDYQFGCQSPTTVWHHHYRLCFKVDSVCLTKGNQTNDLQSFPGLVLFIPQVQQGLDSYKL